MTDTDLLNLDAKAQPDPKSNNGRRVSQYNFEFQGKDVKSYPNEKVYLVFENDFHGDYDIDWIVHRLTSNDKEVMRFNTRFAKHIIFE